MIGKRFWSTGISLRFGRYNSEHESAWAGSLNFYDEGFADDNPPAGRISTQDRLQTRYFVPVEGQHGDALASVTEVLRTDANRLDIEFRDPYLYAQGDGEAPKNPLPPRGIEAIRAEADRIGWGSPGYGLEEV